VHSHETETRRDMEVRDRAKTRHTSVDTMNQDRDTQNHVLMRHVMSLLRAMFNSMAMLRACEMGIDVV